MYRARWATPFVVALVLALALVLWTRPADRDNPLSPPNIGAGHAAAAPAERPGNKANGRMVFPTASARSATPAPAPRQDPAPKATPAVSADPRGFDLRHAPTVDAATIARVLQSYNSPAVGAAETMYRLGVQYGIDPAYCLAFFIHESTAGTAGVARVTKSVGNIRHTPGYRNYEGYRHYDSWEEGIEDWYKLITELYIDGWGLTTVDAIIPVYAPWSDGNNPDGYAATVKKLVAGWRQ